MAKVYGGAGGLDGLRRDADEEAQYPIPEGVSVIEFDPSTNGQLVTFLNTDWNSLTIVGGVLVRNGQPVTVNADGADFDEYRQLRQQVSNLRAYVQLANPSNAQTVAALKLLIRVVLFVVKKLAIHGLNA